MKNGQERLVRIVAVRSDGFTITAEEKSRASAMKEAVRWSCQKFYVGGSKIVKVFLWTEADGLEEFFLEDLLCKTEQVEWADAVERALVQGYSPKEAREMADEECGW
jgi:hypothetical protein